MDPARIRWTIAVVCTSTPHYPTSWPCQTFRFSKDGSVEVMALLKNELFSCVNKVGHDCSEWCDIVRRYDENEQGLLHVRTYFHNSFKQRRVTSSKKRSVTDTCIRIIKNNGVI